MDWWQKIPRRGFFKQTALLTGAAGLGMVSAQTPSAMATATPPPLPWGYRPLDPEKVRKLGHLASYLEGCGGGAFWAIMTALREKIGGPYQSCLPLPEKEEIIAYLSGKSKGKPKPLVMMAYAYSGVMGYGSLCGTLNGPAAAISMALPFKDAKTIIERLMHYYERTPLPSDQANRYAAEKSFLVPKMLVPGKLPQSVSHSVLCHASVTNWCLESGFASGSPQRLERCARLTGDLAAVAVEMMNAQAAGKLESRFPPADDPATAGCRKCHFEGPDFNAGQFTRGAMECGSCHGEMKNHHTSK